jgi:hypothetical protein
MSVTVLFVLLFAVLVYWLYTQILPERQKTSLLRPNLGEGLVTHLNERRRERGLPLLELDEDLCIVAENKAVHQVMTGQDDEGWDYPEEYADLFGRSLLMEALFTGPMTTMVERMIRQHDVFDGEWIGCGIGVAGGGTSKTVVALILCREAWRPATEAAQHSELVKGY